MNVYQYIRSIYFFTDEETFDESDSKHVLKNPCKPFRGAELTQSDAPIPYVTELDITTEVTSKRRKRRSSVTVVSVCEVIFKDSRFAR